eukprot:GEMP01004402.1.p1 GENE.GEMP01004402.1~~GEMP01004402.1.p1  ORF type:complete len:727 (+),score=118.99 GEMP01004402.1:606-2786(+)
MKQLWWVAFAATYDWQRIESQGRELPKARQGHVAIPYGDAIYVIGGCVMDLSCFNDVERFDTQTRVWQPLGLDGEPMEARGGHSVAMFGSRAYISFGASSDNSFDDVFRIDLKERRWLKGQTVRSTASPGIRTNHASCAGKGGQIYTFGGYDVNQGEYLNDIWVMDTFWDGQWQDKDTFPIIWTKVDARGTLPSGRESHSASCVDDRVYIIGGYTDGHTVGDVYVFDTVDGSWSFNTPIAPFPQARQSHIGLRLGLSVVVAGGCDISHESEVCFNDVWNFDVNTSRWTQKSSDMLSWKPREGAAGAFIGTHLFIFGGQSGQRSFGDIIALDTHELQCVHGMAMPDGCRCDHGFGGHDCMDVEECPFACHEHGECRNGQCECEVGFFGDSCQREMPCPNKCSKHGLCLSDASCQCYPGYSGFNCSFGHARCPEDCNGRGNCKPDATCTCDWGWTGTSCTVEQNCPLDCCGQGTCGVKQCVCSTAWFGPACNLNWGTYQMLTAVAKQQSEQLYTEAKDKLTQAEKTKELKVLLAKSGQNADNLDVEIETLTKKARFLEQQAENSSVMTLHGLGVDIQTCQPIAMSTPIMSLLHNVPNSQSSHELGKTNNAWHKFGVAPHKVKFSNPTPDDFGVTDVQERGAVGSVKSECEDNCNSRGFCVKGTCYCQPDHYGSTCNEVKHSKKGTVSLATMAMGTGMALLFSIICTISFLQYRNREKRKAEREMGYLV